MAGETSIQALGLNIADIGQEGRRVSGRVEGDQVHQLLADSGLELAAGETHVDFDLVANLVQQSVVVDGRLGGRMWVECSRCLGPAAIELDEPKLRRTYLSASMFERDAESEIELTHEDLDVSMHDGKTIDLGGLVRECLLLAVPIAPVCRAECVPTGTGAAGADDDLPGWKEALKRLKR